MPVSYWFVAPEPCEWLTSPESSTEPPAFRLALRSDNAEVIDVRGLGDLASLSAACRFIGSGMVAPPAPCGEIRVVKPTDGARPQLDMIVRTDKQMLDGFTSEFTPLELRVDLDGLVPGTRGAAWEWDPEARPSLAITSAMLRTVDLTNPEYREDRVRRPRSPDGSRGKP